MLQGQVSKSLHRASPFDTALVRKIVEQYRDRQIHFCGSHFQSRQHKRDVPARFLLLNQRDLTKEPRFERPQEFRVFAGSFFNGVGGAHTHERFRGKHGIENLGEEFFIR